ncbi:hypothetical protein SpCBS45565_g07532 [Spizellomyces sp. 'palustris']|nr:hypothetical protein SpCBS45565_g07532 [Spizellomyces sp. 'palustris']
MYWYGKYKWTAKTGTVEKVQCLDSSCTVCADPIVVEQGVGVGPCAAKGLVLDEAWNATKAGLPRPYINNTDVFVQSFLLSAKDTTTYVVTGTFDPFYRNCTSVLTDMWGISEVRPLLTGTSLLNTYLCKTGRCDIGTDSCRLAYSASAFNDVSMQQYNASVNDPIPAIQVETSEDGWGVYDSGVLLGQSQNVWPIYLAHLANNDTGLPTPTSTYLPSPTSTFDANNTNGTVNGTTTNSSPQGRSLSIIHSIVLIAFTSAIIQFVL